MEARAQPLDVAASARAAGPPAGRRGRAAACRSASPAGISIRETRPSRASSRSATPMSTTSVSGGRLAFGSMRRQVGRAFEPRGGLGRGEGEERRQHEGAQAVEAGAEAGEALGGQRHRLDADDAQAARRRAGGRPRCTGETFQPARRSASQSSSAILPPSRASTAARRAAAGDRGGAVVARARLGVQRLHAGPERGRRGEAGEQGDELERVPPPVAEERGEDRGHPSRPACSRTVAPSRAASRALWVADQQRRAGLGDERQHQRRAPRRRSPRRGCRSARRRGSAAARRRAPGRSPRAAAGRRRAARGSGRAGRRARAGR